MKTINVLNVPDFRKPDGSWGKFYSEVTDDDCRLSMHTRAAVLWNNLKSRCREGSAQRKNSTSYVQIENHFDNYDVFTEWCQGQYGYMNKSASGIYWNLDKDLLHHGNKIYSPDTCMFIPLSVNTVMMASDVCRGKFPVGVQPHYQVKKTRYTATCRRRDGSGYVGIYDTPEEAHKAWQLAKVDRILEEASDHPEHIKMYEALMWHIDRIRNDYENDRETKVEWWTDRGLTIQ
jgi:hypothetical protein